MKINNLNKPVDEYYTHPDFLIMLESHLEYLRINNVGFLPITNQQNIKFAGDLYGILNEKNIDKKFHYIISRLNNYNSSSDYKGDKSELLLPDVYKIEELNRIFSTEHHF